MIHKHTAFCIAAALAVAMTSAAYASSVYLTEVEFGGTDSVSGQTNIIGLDETVSWTVTQVGDVFTYAYVFPEKFGKHSLSHFTLDISNSFIGDADLQNELVDSFDTNGLANGDSTIEFGDKDGLTGAVKFDYEADEDNDEPMYIEFTSSRIPVYQHFVVKAGGGKKGTFHNPGFDDVASMNVLNFIAAPDTDIFATPIGPVPAPLPAAAWGGMMLLSGLGATHLWKRRRA